MTSSLAPRRAVTADEDSIIELEQIVWGSAEEATHSYFQWCLKNPTGRSITYIIKDDSGRVLAMRMLMFTPARLKGKPIMAGILINGATHPNFRRKGFSNQIAHAIYYEAQNLGIEFLFSSVNSMTYALYTGKHNFSDPGKPLLLTRWIDPGIFLRQKGFSRSGNLISFVTKLSSRVWQKPRNNISRVKEVENLEGLKVEGLWEPTDFCFAIDGHWLKWRYRDHPFRRYECVVIGEPDSPEALVVFEVMAMYKRALIMEFFATQEVSSETVLALMVDVVEKCKAAGCSSVSCLGSPLSRKTALLRKIGFWAFPFDSVWRPRIVVNSQNLLPAEFSLSYMDICYGALINVG